MINNQLHKYEYDNPTKYFDKNLQQGRSTKLHLEWLSHVNNNY